MQLKPTRSMQSGELQKNILSTYWTLRAGLVVLSFVFPLVLYFGGRWWGHVDHLADSMSAYYGQGGGHMRNWFVGILWAVGFFLYLYKGFSPLENWLLNLAGTFAVIVAMAPCHCWTEDRVGNPIHGTSAILFFVCMAAVCFFCAEQTLTLLPKDERRPFERRYRLTCAAFIVAVLIPLALWKLFPQFDSYKFFIEMFGVWVFAYYWLTKTREFKKTCAEELALHGVVANQPGVGLVKLAVPPPPSIYSVAPTMTAAEIL
jgi:hypothetical protein